MGQSVEHRLGIFISSGRSRLSAEDGQMDPHLRAVPSVLQSVHSAAVLLHWKSRLVGG